MSCKFDTTQRKVLFTSLPNLNELKICKYKKKNNNKKENKKQGSKIVCLCYVGTHTQQHRTRRLRIG